MSILKEGKRLKKKNVMAKKRFLVLSNGKKNFGPKVGAVKMTFSLFSDFIFPPCQVFSHLVSDKFRVHSGFAYSVGLYST